MAQYKLIFITQPDVPEAGMKGLLAWAEKGGMLAAVSNAGSGDRYNTPSTVLSEAAQVTEPPRTRLMFASEVRNFDWI